MKFVLAAGGTGGHLIPALAFAAHLRDRGEEVTLLRGCRPLEESICQAFGEPALELPMRGSPFGAGLRHFPGRMWMLWRSYQRARRVLKELQPDVVLLFGGYLSFPVGIAAEQLKIPLFTHEQNAVAGRATRYFDRQGVKIFTAWPRCDGLKTSFDPVGIPVRRLTLPRRSEARQALFGGRLRDGEKLLLILGGSLGSGGLAERFIGQNMLKLNDWRLCFMGLKPEDRPFEDALTLETRWDMSAPYAAADLILSRGGGATLAELSAYGLKALVWPWEKSADGHQQANAEEFSKKTGLPSWDGTGGVDGLLTLMNQALEATTPCQEGPEASALMYQAVRAALGKV